MAPEEGYAENNRLLHSLIIGSVAIFIYLLSILLSSTFSGGLLLLIKLGFLSISLNLLSIGASFICGQKYWIEKYHEQKNKTSSKNYQKWEGRLTISSLIFLKITIIILMIIGVFLI